MENKSTTSTCITDVRNLDLGLNPDFFYDGNTVIFTDIGGNITRFRIKEYHAQKLRAGSFYTILFINLYDPRKEKYATESPHAIIRLWPQGNEIHYNIENLGMTIPNILNRQF